ncbi:hypothetical protein KJ903_05440, partial [Patescibacteria group bacterium]|nr:hypothetical protein [Patescibacteria group bacterium]
TQWAIEARMNDNLIAAVLLADFDPTRNDLSLGENWVSIRTDDADESLKMSRLTEAESLRDRLFEKLVDLQ